jgi:hypothetical protein
VDKVRFVIETHLRTGRSVAELAAQNRVRPQFRSSARRLAGAI